MDDDRDGAARLRELEAENAFLREEMERITAKLIRMEASRLEAQMEARRRDRTFRFLQALSREIVAARDRTAIYRATVRSLTRDIGFDRAVIYRREQGVYEPVAVEGYASGDETRYLRDPFFAPWVEMEGSVLVNGRNRSEVEADYETALQARFFVAASFPFSLQTEERHILFVGNRTEETVRRPRLTEDDRDILATLVRQIAVALENATLYHTLEARVKERTRLLEAEIGERKRAEAETERLNRRLNTLIESLPDAIYFKDMAGRYRVVNAAFERMNGVTRAAILGRTDAEVFPTEPARRYRRSDRLVHDRRRLIHSTMEVPGPDGDRRILDCVKVPLFDPDGEFAGLVGMNRDITRQRRMEAELFKARKLEAIAILTGGIAHDFNNLLTVIIGNLSLLRLDGPLSESPPGDADRILRRAENAANQARDLTRKLIVFSKGGAPFRRPLDGGTLLRKAAEDARDRLGMAVELSVPADLPSLEADAEQLRMALDQLLQNAREAMPDAPWVRISAAEVEVGELDGVRLTPGRYARISIRDRGPGIPPDNLEDIFDPYFTTKPMGADRGVGLGLGIVHSVATRHGGAVFVESRPGEGAVFHLHIPVVAEAPTEAGPEAPAGLSAVRVLLMDDEAPVREVAGAMLRRLGYETVAVREGNEAAEAFRQARGEGRPFRVVLLDLTVKHGIGGVAALRRLREIDPDVNALVSSGYAQDPVLRDFREYGFKGAIPKPYGIRELRRALDALPAGDG